MNDIKSISNISNKDGILSVTNIMSSSLLKPSVSSSVINKVGDGGGGGESGSEVLTEKRRLSSASTTALVHNFKSSVAGTLFSSENQDKLNSKTSRATSSNPTNNSQTRSKLKKNDAKGGSISEAMDKLSTVPIESCSSALSSASRYQLNLFSNDHSRESSLQSISQPTSPTKVSNTYETIHDMSNATSLSVPNEPNVIRKFASSHLLDGHFFDTKLLENVDNLEETDV
jgi:hypothetical protein